LIQIKYIFIFFLFSFSVFQAQTKVTNATGNWGTASIWTPAGVPTATDDVLISDGQTIGINVNAVCRSLRVGNGGAACELRFTGGTPLTLSVTTNVTVSANGVFRPRNTSTANHTMAITGNIINNGTFDFARDANSTATIIFNRNGNQSISGTGALTEVSSIILNMGTSASNILDIQSSNFTTSRNFLRLTNGTLRLSTINAISVVPFTVVPTIPVTAGLWVNSANAIVTSSTTVNLNGRMTVSAGSLTIGNANNEDITSNGGTVIVTGGTLNIAGKYNGGASASTFSLTGGFVNLPIVSTNNTTTAPFNVTTTGSRFDMTGGVLTIVREGGTGAQDLGFVNTGSTLGSVTGGTIQLGRVGTPATQTLSINSTATIPNLVIASASVTAKLLTNNLNVLGNISIGTGTLNANNLGITLGGNWTNTSTFVPGTGTVTFNSTVNQTISRTGGETFNNLFFGGSGIKTFSSAITTSSNFSISTGSSVDVSASNFQLTVRGNFFNNGLFNSRSGLVFFNGTVAQTINGTSLTDFYDLTLNNTAGLTLNANERLINTLTLNNGTFNTNGRIFTMVSTATNTARIAQITGSGDISGNVTLQRFAPGGTTGWALFGAPMSSALTFSDWDDNIFISCPTCPDGYAPNFTSIYSYDETATGSYSMSNSYLPISAVSDPIDPNKGYWVYLGTNQFTTTGITLDVVGTVRKNVFVLPLNFTSSGSTADDGWNLICNPYPSPISWNALRGLTPNIDNAIYVFNADLNGGAGATASFINGISSPAIVSGGIGDAIPIGQGFYVHSTGATGLSVQESIKLSSNQALLRGTSTNTTQPLIRFSINGGNSFNDESVLYFQQGASNVFDQQYDAIKFISQGPGAPLMALQQGNIDFQVNGIPPIVGTYTTLLKTTTGFSGTYTIHVSDDESFPKGACINLYDRFLNISTDLRQNPYVFQLSDTTRVARFILTINLTSLNISSQLVQPSCSQPTAGLIVARGNNAGPWNYYWKQNGQIIKTSLNKSTSDSLSNLNGADYELQVNTVGSCDNNTSQYTVNAIEIAQSNFLSVDTLYLNQSDSVQFINQSMNAISYNWDFGDQTTSTDINPVKYFNLPGTYSITLQANSSTGCMNTFSKTLQVETEPLSTQKQIKSKTIYRLKSFENNSYEVVCLNCGNTALRVKLFDMGGNLIKDFGQIFLNQNPLKVNLEGYQAGIYVLLLVSENESTSIKLSR